MNLKALSLCILMFSHWKSVKYTLAFNYILELNVPRTEMLSSAGVSMLDAIGITPTLLLDEIRSFPLLCCCVTVVTQDRHMILYQVVAKNKRERWDSFSLTSASSKLCPSQEWHWISPLQPLETCFLTLWFIQPRSSWCKVPLSLGCRMAKHLRLGTSFNITRNYITGVLIICFPPEHCSCSFGEHLKKKLQTGNGLTPLTLTDPHWPTLCSSPFSVLLCHLFG